MKRTPPWVFVAAAAIQFAALGLCVWAMEQHHRREEDATVPAPEPRQAPRVEALASPPPAVPAEVFAVAPVPVEAAPVEAAPVSAAPVEAPPPLAPRFGPPPEQRQPRIVQPEREPFPPRFISEAADTDAQIMRGSDAADRSLVFGFYSDGNIRFVDGDGARYSGKAESARARMREVGGTRAFTVQIGVAADGGLVAAFTGGAHDSETIALDPLVGGTVA